MVDSKDWNVVAALLVSAGNRARAGSDKVVVLIGLVLAEALVDRQQ